MNLTKYEQSGFILETKKGFRLAFDIGNKTPIEKLDGVKSVDAFFGFSYTRRSFFYSTY